MTFERGPSAAFMGAASTIVDGGFAIFGAPYDGTASYRPGSRFGPDAIRAASEGLESYSPLLDADLEDIDYADVGDIDWTFGAPSRALENVRAAVSQILSAGGRPVMFGGEHSLTAAAFHAIREQHPDVVILQLDAHADLRDEYLGEPNSHACAMRRSIEAGSELIQLGIRSGTRDEWRWMREHKTLYGIDRLAERLADLDAPVYVTVDIDVFDPSVVPGTGTPEPGGIDWAVFEDVVRTLDQAAPNIVGFDVMELAPKLDPTGVSDVVAAKVVRELMLTFA